MLHTRPCTDRTAPHTSWKTRLLQAPHPNPCVTSRCERRLRVVVILAWLPQRMPSFLATSCRTLAPRSAPPPPLDRSCSRFSPHFFSPSSGSESQPGGDVMWWWIESSFRLRFEKRHSPNTGIHGRYRARSVAVLSKGTSIATADPQSSPTCHLFACTPSLSLYRATFSRPRRSRDLGRRLESLLECIGHLSRLAPHRETHRERTGRSARCMVRLSVERLRSAGFPGNPPGECSGFRLREVVRGRPGMPGTRRPLKGPNSGRKSTRSRKEILPPLHRAILSANSDT